MGLQVERKLLKIDPTTVGVGVLVPILGAEVQILPLAKDRYLGNWYLLIRLASRMVLRDREYRANGPLNSGQTREINSQQIPEGLIGLSANIPEVRRVFDEDYGIKSHEQSMPWALGIAAKIDKENYRVVYNPYDLGIWQKVDSFSNSMVFQYLPDIEEKVQIK